MSGGPAESRSTFKHAKASGLDRAMTDLAKETIKQSRGYRKINGSTLGTQKGGKDAQVKAGVFEKR